MLPVTRGWSVHEDDDADEVDHTEQHRRHRARGGQHHVADVVGEQLLPTVPRNAKSTGRSTTSVLR